MSIEYAILLRHQYLQTPSSPLRLTRLAECEIVTHLMYIDLQADGPPLTNDEMMKCRKRFLKFCQDQWKGREK